MIRPGFVTFLPLLLVSGTAALAQEDGPKEATPACTSPAALPPELSGWAQPHKAVTAATKASGLKGATLALGAAADTALAPTPAVKFAVDPDKPGGSVSHGGLFAFTITQPGAYRVALSSGAWVDVIEDGRAAVSTAHGHGPDCSGIRKMVDYSLKAGPHVLQVSANGSAALSLMVAPLP